MALEEELQLDLGPALDSIRGELARSLEDIPANFRSAFDDTLTGLVSDFGAAAELAKGELERVFAAPVEVAPVEVPVDVDTTQLDAVPGEIDAAGSPIDVPVEVDASQVASAADEIKAIDGETVSVAVEVDTSGISDAQDQIDSLSSSATSGGGGGAPVLGLDFAAASVAAKEYAGTLSQVGGASLASQVAAGGAAATIGLFAKEAIDADFATKSFDGRVGDLADTLNHVNVAGLNTSLDDLAVKVGANNENIRLALARFVQLSEGSGKSRVEVGNLGQSLNALSSYLSVTNPQLGSADEIINRLPNALARGGRFLAQYGIALSTVDINQRAMSDSGKTAAADLSIFEKQAAGLELAMEKLGPAIASGIGSGSDIAAVKLRSLRESLRETVVQAGEPIVDPLIRGLTALEPPLESAAKLVGAAGGAFADVLAPAVAVAADVLTPVADLLDRIPKPVLDLAAALYVGNKAIGLFTTGLQVVVDSAKSVVVAVTATEGPLATLEAAQISAAAASEANAAAQVELQVALGAAVAFAEEDATAQAALATAQAAAAATAEAEAAALKQVAVAEGAAESVIAPLVVGLVALAAAYKGVTSANDALGIDTQKFADVSGPALIGVLKRFEDVGQGTKFFKELADGSVEEAQRLRDALADQGADVRKFDRILDDANKRQKERDANTAASSKETQKLIDTLKNGEPAAKAAAAATLSQSVGYKLLSEDTRKAVDEQVRANGVNDRVAKSAADAKKALEDEATAAKGAADAFTAAGGALQALIGINFTSQQQELNYQITLDKTDASLKETIKSKGIAASQAGLDTPVQRENLKTLQDTAKAQADIAAQILATPDVEDPSVTKARYQAQIDGLYAVYKQTGLTRVDFDKYLADVGLLPKQLNTDVAITGLDEAKTKLDTFKSNVEKLPISIRVESKFDAVEAYKQIVASLAQFGPIPVNATLSEASGRDVAAEAARIAEGVAANLVPATTSHSEGGVFERYADGGIRALEHYANGGMREHYAAGGEDHTAQIATTQRTFAEPETGGEAYIPLSPAKRERSTEILGTVANQFGYQLVPVGAQRYADGAVVDTSSVGAWSDGRMVDAIERVVTAIQGIPAQIPRAGDTFNLPLTPREQNAVREIAERVVRSSRRA